MSLQTQTMQAILANVFLAVMKRLATSPDLKFIDQDMGQLDFDDEPERNTVKFPCALFDIVQVKYSDNSRNQQMGEAVLELRLGLAAYTAATHYYTKDSHRENALEYFNTEHRVVKLLHGWSDGEYFNPLSRVSSATERRKDNVRVRVLRFAFGFKDSTAMEVFSQMARPEMEVLPNTN